MKTYQRVFSGLGEQVLGHCKYTKRKHIENMILFRLDFATNNINKALEIKATSLGITL